MTINSGGSGLPLSSTKFELDDAIFQPNQPLPIIVPFNPTSVPSPVSLTEKSDFGINVLTNRIAERKVLGGKDDDSKIVSYELRTKDGVRYNGDPSTINEGTLYGINIPVEKQDTSESILLKGYEAAAYYVGGVDAKRIAAQVVAEQQDAEDAKKDPAGKAIAASGLRNIDVKTGKVGDAKVSSDIQAHRRDGSMNFWVSGTTLKRMDQIHAQKLVMDALQSGEMPTDELLNRAGGNKNALNAALKEAGWQPIPTHEEAVNKLATEKYAEIIARQKDAQSKPYIDTSWAKSKWFGMTDEQIAAETRREATVEIDRAVGKGEVTLRSSSEPASIRATNNSPFRTDVKLLVEKFFPEWNTPEGPTTTNAEAMVYGWINARTFGATDFYVDKSRFNNESQANEAWAMQKFGMITGEFQNLRAAGKTVEAIMATPKITKAVVALNNSGVFGRTLVKSLPSAATFGGVQTAKETVKLSKGESEGVAKAVANITKAATEGAVFGVLQPLPLKAQIPTVAASSYGIEKVFGADNQQAAQTALLNGIFAIAGGRTNAAKELNGKTIRITGENGTAANVRLSVAPNGRIRLTELPQSFKAHLQVKASELKAAVQAKVDNAGQYLRDKVAVTDVQVADARKVIADYRQQQARGLVQPASLYMPPAPVEGKVYKAYTVLAKKALVDGMTSFKDFSAVMIRGKGRDIKPHLDKLYEETASESIVKANQRELQAFRTEEARIKESFKMIQDFRKANGIPEFKVHRNEVGDAAGTVSAAKSNGQVEFGTNTLVGEKYLGTKNEAFRQQGMFDIQIKLGKLKGARYNDINTAFLTHAEAESLMKLAQKNGGKLPSEVEIFVDRPTCFACRGKKDDVGVGLSLLTELYGVKKLTVHDSYGTKYIIRPNQKTEVVKIDGK